MKKDKIIELRIDDDDAISGIDSISLVDEPAIEINWVAFNKEKPHEFHIPDGEDEKYLEMLIAKAESEEDLLASGYVLDHVELLDSKEAFATNPNANSEWDEPDFKVRYKYMLNPRITGQAAVIDTTRTFCRDLVSKNFVWRVEEMDNLRNSFGDSALVWRGGFNCRHIWGKMIYRKDATIVNKASINKGKVDVDGFPSGLAAELDVIGYEQPNTVTNKTLNNPSPSTIRNLGLSKQKFEYPLFPTKEDAEYYAEEVLNCKGSHEHDVNGKIYYMPCEEHPEDMGYDVGGISGYVDPGIKKKKKGDFQSYSDYPLAASDNARKALKWAEKNGWGDCGTPVGKIRANQLASRQSISEETISRMASFERHRQNKDVPYDKGCGGLMWDAWGGTEGIEWAQRKLRQIENAKFNNQKFEIQSEEKRIVVGPAMVPDLRIFRKDKKGNPYHVFFSEKTIRMIAEKYMRNKYIDNNDTNHDGKAVKDVYVIESWIKEDDNDKSNKYGYEDLPVGTWFVSMKVRNDDVWQKVKEGRLRGYSVSGYFEEIEQFAREEMFLNELAKFLKTIKE